MFSVAKSQIAGVLVRSCFAHWSFLLPLKRIRENPYIVAFYHPKPAYHHHVVIVPKKQIPNLFVLGKYPQYAAALFTAAQEIVAAFHWEPGNYVFCANGGPRQDVSQVHFHLYAGSSPLLSLKETKAELVQESETVKVVCCARSEQSLQLRLIPHHRPGNSNTSGLASLDAPVFSTLLQVLPTLDQQFHLMQQGYTFVVIDVAPQHALDATGYILTRLI
jgi:diadenosine tetraphosphate (Ap4A) HIT family hydrolase